MRVHWIILAVLIGALLAGCGDAGDAGTTEGQAERTREQPAKEPPKVRAVTVTLDGYPGPENVGLLMADKRGYFADAGLKVEMTRPLSPGVTTRYVAYHLIDLGISHQPQVAIEKEEGKPIVAVGSLVSQPTAAMIWPGNSGIRDIADLKGKTIAIPGLDFQMGLLESVLTRAGLSLDEVEVERVGNNLVRALVDGRADAIFGGSGNVEGIELEARGLKPVVATTQSLGIPSYDELVVIAQANQANNDPELVQDFMAAVARGTAAAVEDPRGAVEAIRGHAEANSATSRRATRLAVEATLPLLSESGQMSSDQADELVSWMGEEGMLQGELPVSEVFSNRFLGSEP